MSDTTELLNSLRDIHEPLAPQGTSLLLLAGNATLLIAIIAFLVWHYYRHKNAWRRQALVQLNRARNARPEQSMLQMAKLLRQILLHRQHDCQHLTGHAYLQMLDSAFSTHWFTQGDGKHFGNEIYQPFNHELVSIDNMHRQLTSLISALPHTPNTRST